MQTVVVVQLHIQILYGEKIEFSCEGSVYNMTYCLGCSKAYMTIVEYSKGNIYKAKIIPLCDETGENDEILYKFSFSDLKTTKGEKIKIGDSFHLPEEPSIMATHIMGGRMYIDSIIIYR